MPASPLQTNKDCATVVLQKRVDVVFETCVYPKNSDCPIEKHRQHPQLLFFLLVALRSLASITRRRYSLDLVHVDFSRIASIPYRYVAIECNLLWGLLCLVATRLPASTTLGATNVFLHWRSLVGCPLNVYRYEYVYSK